MLPALLTNIALIGRGSIAASALVLAVSTASRSSAEDDLKLTGFPSLVLSGGSANAQTHPMPAPFDNVMKADTLEIVLEQTTLKDVLDQFGGIIRTRGDQAASVATRSKSATATIANGSLPTGIRTTARPS